MTFTKPVTLPGTCPLEPDLPLTHLGFQQHPQLLHSAIFAKSELGFRDFICLDFVIVWGDVYLCAEGTDVD